MDQFMPILVVVLIALALAVALGLVVMHFRERRHRAFQVPNKLPKSVARDIARRELPRRPDVPRHT